MAYLPFISGSAPSISDLLSISLPSLNGVFLARSWGGLAEHVLSWGVSLASSPWAFYRLSTSIRFVWGCQFSTIVCLGVGRGGAFRLFLIKRGGKCA